MTVPVRRARWCRLRGPRIFRWEVRRADPFEVISKGGVRFSGSLPDGERLSEGRTSPTSHRAQPSHGVTVSFNHKGIAVLMNPLKNVAELPEQLSDRNAMFHPVLPPR